jgi:hypothetical protein
MKKSPKNIVLLICYLFVLANIGFHHHTATDLNPHQTISSESENLRHSTFLSAEKCPIVHFASTSFACQSIDSKDVTEFSDEIDYLLIDRTSNTFNFNLNLSSRAPPVV